MNKLDNLFKLMWNDYIKMNPQAQNIVELLQGEGETVVNDHIALRTYDFPEVTIDKIAAPFVESGYKEMQTYDFEQKKLFAKHFEHEDERRPKVFISELLTKNFSEQAQKIMHQKMSSLTQKQVGDFNFMVSGRSWGITSEEYNLLSGESEYAAWVAAIGFRPNHFTVFINELKKFSELEKLNAFLKDNGFKLNSSGGEIKGGPDQFLEQSSTMADSIDVEMDDTTLNIPSCYFEFAKRYPLANGKLYQGFVATSADKIFESTDRSK
ncbi:MAG: succinyldiaminopimelate aminotransferase [Halobacteriovoraceae bacterium]|nr:succinyldiaminopimelate aminotransferase [Halobacteriovoraceae bacterium]|tara:strand:+ start:655 stop:1455 length:801 start_codon:yes stop_codon:yes gene_type:complete